MRRPDRHATTLVPESIEVGNNARAPPGVPLIPRGHGVLRDQYCPVFVKLRQLVVGGKNIRRNLRHVLSDHASNGLITVSGMRGVRFSSAMKRRPATWNTVRPGQGSNHSPAAGRWCR